MNQLTMTRVVLIASLLLLTGRVTLGQGDDADGKKGRLQLMTASVSDVTMALSDGSAIELQTKPLLRWSNPVSGIDDGTYGADAGRGIEGRADLVLEDRCAKARQRGERLRELLLHPLRVAPA